MAASAATQSHALTTDYLREAVHHNRKASKQGVLERLFTLWFRGWVYNQIWEDPRVDADAMQLGPGSRVLTISSGGCNVLNYLLNDPEQVVAIDLNTCHMSLCRLKLAAVRHLPAHDDFYRMFGHGEGEENLDNYNAHLRHHLDDTTRHYWESTDWPSKKLKIGTKRLKYLRKGFYNASKLGQLIRIAHILGRITGTPYERLLDAKTREEQQQFFDEVVAPYFDNAFVKWATRNPLTGFSLGIPPSQYKIMHAESGGKVCQVFRERVRRLVVDFPMQENYFAWQAFGRRYDHENRRAIPDYLREESFPVLRDRIGRVETHVMSLTRYLHSQPSDSLNRFVLLDSQDWMPPHVIAELWREIDRVGQPGTRIIFRTSGSESPIETALPPELRSRFVYEREASAAYYDQDRSAIYGGFHLYLKPQ